MMIHKYLQYKIDVAGVFVTVYIYTPKLRSMLWEKLFLLAQKDNKASTWFEVSLGAIGDLWLVTLLRSMIIVGTKCEKS